MRRPVTGAAPGIVGHGVPRAPSTTHLLPRAKGLYAWLCPRRTSYRISQGSRAPQMPLSAAHVGLADKPAREDYSDIPKLPRPLPRYLTADLDRRLTTALETCRDRLAADALLLARNTGLRIEDAEPLLSHVEEMLQRPSVGMTTGRLWGARKAPLHPARVRRG